MPVEFVRQDVCENVKCASTRLTLDYDGSGRRISKTVWRKAAGESGWTKDNITHYTGIGTEVRENFAGSTPGAKVVVSLPEGLGRYAPGDASENADAKPLKDENGNELAGMLPGTNFEWYLKNHLGSTMLVFGTQSAASPDVADNGTLKAAYDYHAFGEQLTLAEPTDKVTENFTGKGIRGERCDSRVYSNWHCRAEEHCARRNEKDDEIELNYFGARYLDPMLGLWTSVDPARQFASPYLYAGNGMNPLMGMDEDGESMQFVAGFFTSIPIAAYNMVMAEKEAYEAHMSYWSIVERGVGAWLGTLFFGSIFNPSSFAGVLTYGAVSSAAIDVLLQMENCNSDFDWNRVTSAAAGGAIASSLALGAEKIMSNYVLGPLAEGVAGFAASAAWTTFMVFAEPSPELAPDPIEQCEDE